MIKSFNDSVKIMKINGCEDNRGVFVISAEADGVGSDIKGAGKEKKMENDNAKQNDQMKESTIKRGSVIIDEVPIFFALFSDSVCKSCLKPLIKTMSGGELPSVIVSANTSSTATVTTTTATGSKKASTLGSYCSDDCKDRDVILSSGKKVYSKIEEVAKKYDVDKYLFEIVLRMLLRMQAKDIIATEWDRINSLISHVDKMPLSWTSAVREALKDLVSSKIAPSLQLSEDIISNGLEFAAIINSNSHGIEMENEYGQRTVAGFGLFPLCSMVNHSCEPNSILRWDWESCSMKISALKDTEAGEEISINYIDIVQPWRQRQDQLLKSKHFLCNCKRCAKRDQGDGNLNSIIAIEDSMLEAISDNTNMNISNRVLVYRPDAKEYFCNLNNNGKSEEWIIDDETVGVFTSKYLTAFDKVDQDDIVSIESFLQKYDVFSANKSAASSGKKKKTKEKAANEAPDVRLKLHCDHFLVIKANILLTHLYLKSGNQQRAFECINRATKSISKSPIPDTYPEYADILEYYSLFTFSKVEKEKNEIIVSSLETSSKILSSVLGDSHPQTKRVIKKLKSAQSQLQ